MQTPPPESTPTNYPRPNLDNNRQVLREVAGAQKQVMYCVLAQIGLIILNVIAGASHLVALNIVVPVLALALVVYQILSVIRLTKSLDKSPVLYAILMFIPCISLIMLLVLNSNATKVLQQAGIKVGLLGADPNSI